MPSRKTASSPSSLLIIWFLLSSNGAAIPYRSSPLFAAAVPTTSQQRTLLTLQNRASMQSIDEYVHDDELQQTEEEDFGCCTDCAHCVAPQHAARCLQARGGSDGHVHHLMDSTVSGDHSHAHSHAIPTKPVTPLGLPLTLWKCVFQLFLTALNIACWYLPLQSRQITESPVLLSLANAFSGGVFLALAFGHLIPECVHKFSGILTSPLSATPYWLVLGGYLLIFVIEKVAFGDAHELLHAGGDTGGAHSHSHGHSHSHALSESNGTNMTTSSLQLSPADAQLAAAKGGSNARSAVLLLTALGVHSVLEMMALGLSNTFPEGALLTLSIALHQPAESLALLVAFIKSGLSKQRIAQYLFVFSLMGPLGVSLGIIVNHYADPLVDASMLAVVAGTFVYVGATEVIPEEWHGDSETASYKWNKLGALVAGLVTIYAVMRSTEAMGGHVH